MEFEINPYIPCIAKKMVTGTHTTIRWHGDNLMISHLNQEDIMQVVEQIKDIYGKNIKENVGTVHEYIWGIHLNTCSVKKCKSTCRTKSKK
jgi:hypothetical protein